MVLKNSKWDKKAKYKYLKKHGLTQQRGTNEQNEQKQPHWSSKKPSSADGNAADSDTDWDSEEDEALINHFYPNLGESELTVDQKKKIRKQILAQLEEEEQKREEAAGNNEDDDEERSGEQEEDQDEVDGIYLGTKPKSDSSKETISFDLQQILENAKSSRGSGKRYFKQKMSSNFLEEYGLDDYKETVAKQDIDSYNKTHYEKKATRNLQDISFDELEGFEIGKSQLGEPRLESRPQMQHLSKQDMEEEKRRQGLVEDNKLYNTLRNKYGSSNASKPRKNRVLEINNLNSKDVTQMNNLNSRIFNAQNAQVSALVGDLDEDLAELLGEVALSEERIPTARGDPLDEILRTSQMASNVKKTAPVTSSGIQLSSQRQSQKEHDAFLDDLLG